MGTAPPDRPTPPADSAHQHTSWLATFTVPAPAPAARRLQSTAVGQPPLGVPSIEAIRKVLWTADIVGLIDADGCNDDEYDGYAPTLQIWLAEQLLPPPVGSVVTRLHEMFRGVFHEEPREAALRRLAELLVQLCGGEQQAPLPVVTTELLLAVLAVVSIWVAIERL